MTSPTSAGQRWMPIETALITDERLEALICWAKDNGRCVTEFRDTAAALRQYQKLLALVAAHNANMEQQCKWHISRDHCDGYKARGRDCPTCPNEHAIVWPLDF